MRTHPDPFDQLAGSDDPELIRAWELWCERGVILPEYAGDIAELRRIQREWADEDEPLR